MKSKWHNPKKSIGSNSSNKKEEEVLQPAAEEVRGVVAEVRLHAWRGTSWREQHPVMLEHTPKKAQLN